MKLILTVAFLFVTGCSSADEKPSDEGGAAAQLTEPLHLTALEKRAKSELEVKVRKQQEASELEGRVKSAFADYLLDPSSAQYRSLRAGRGGAVCGKMNGKNRFGAYVGFKDFVLSKDRKTLFVSKSNDGVQTEMFGSFADAYLNVCASSAEKAQHASIYAEMYPDPEPYVPSPTEDAETDFMAAEEGYNESEGE